MNSVTAKENLGSWKQGVKIILAKLKSDRGSGVDARTLLSIMFTAE